ATERRYRSGFILPHIYDYAKNSQVYLCSDVPDMYDPVFIPTVLKELFPLIWQIGGRSLFLFSAKSRFEIAREVLLKEFDPKIPLFIQNMGQQVVDEFKVAPSGILLGMESFGEGLDIAGDKLQFVFIDKVPDLRQDIVINERREVFEKKFGNEFEDYFMAHRARLLHQKLGRLLRTHSDHGGAIIVDARLKRWKKGTLDKFKKMLEPYPVKTTPLKEARDKITEFILEKR
nr:hypothetical protein [Bacteriovoracaceae bacterium]